MKVGEADKYWPGNRGTWKHLVICKDTKIINAPFGLNEILGEESTPYESVQTFKKIAPKYEKMIQDYLRKVGTL